MTSSESHGRFTSGNKSDSLGYKHGACGNVLATGGCVVPSSDVLLIARLVVRLAVTFGERMLEGDFEGCRGDVCTGEDVGRDSRWGAVGE